MPTATKRVSFALVIALLIGWGALSLLLIQSSKELLQAQLLYDGTVIAQPKGVQLSLQVDKKVYKVGESILISIRNDSRNNIWLTEHADGCTDTWWQIQELVGADDWQTVVRVRNQCVAEVFGLQEFPKHSVQTSEWDGLIQTPAIGDIFDFAQTGTYRVTVPFLHGADVEEIDWSSADATSAVSPTFTIQGEGEAA